MRKIVPTMVLVGLVVCFQGNGDAAGQGISQAQCPPQGVPQVFASHAWIPVVPIGPPLGSYWQAQEDVMRSNYYASTFVFHRFHFYNDRVHDSQLNASGMRQLIKIIGRLNQVDFPVIVEAGPERFTPELQQMEEQLAQQRRLTVVRMLQEQNAELSPDRVVVGIPLVRGMRGDEALLIYQKMLEQGPVSPQDSATSGSSSSENSTSGTSTP